MSKLLSSDKKTRYLGKIVQVQQVCHCTLFQIVYNMLICRNCHTEFVITTQNNNNIITHIVLPVCMSMC